MSMRLCVTYEWEVTRSDFTGAKNSSSWHRWTWNSMTTVMLWALANGKFPISSSSSITSSSIISTLNPILDDNGNQQNAKFTCVITIPSYTVLQASTHQPYDTIWTLACHQLASDFLYHMHADRCIAWGNALESSGWYQESMSEWNACNTTITVLLQGITFQFYRFSTCYYKVIYSNSTYSC